MTKERSSASTYNSIKRWSMPSNYFGESWSDYYSAGVGQSRDSDALERSNFAVMLDSLGGESETVLVVRESHWAVGWVEWIAIHESGTKALEEADRQLARLEDYPVLSDDHLSELEMTEANETWSQCYNDQERVDYIRKYRDQFEFHDYTDLLACARGRYFAGYASDLIYR